MGTSIDTMRAAYRALMIASGLTPEEFRAAVLPYAHEAADGEAIEARHWIQGARERAALDARTPRRTTHGTKIPTRGAR